MLGVVVRSRNSFQQISGYSFILPDLVILFSQSQCRILLFSRYFPEFSASRMFNCFMFTNFFPLEVILSV